MATRLCAHAFATAERRLAHPDNRKALLTEACELYARAAVENIKYCRVEVASEKQKRVDGCAANLEVVRQLDWQRVAALLEK